MRKDLFYSRRGQLNEARIMAIYLARRLRRDRLKEIGKAFGIDGYSTVNSAVQRMKVGMDKDELLQKKEGADLFSPILKGFQAISLI